MPRTVSDAMVAKRAALVRAQEAKLVAEEEARLEREAAARVLLIDAWLAAGQLPREYPFAAGDVHAWLKREVSRNADGKADGMSTERLLDHVDQAHDLVLDIRNAYMAAAEADYRFIESGFGDDINTSAFERDDDGSISIAARAADFAKVVNALSCALSPSANAVLCQLCERFDFVHARLAKVACPVVATQPPAKRAKSASGAPLPPYSFMRPSPCYTPTSPTSPRPRKAASSPPSKPVSPLQL